MIAPAPVSKSIIRLFSVISKTEMELSCKIQNYAWGKPGSESLVAQLFVSANKEFKIDHNQKYAELWMGSHVNGPSTIKESGESLADFIQKNPEYLGKEVTETFGSQLPYLFKVLSINTALSIQAHPNKEHAEELHSKFPDIYKDPNHKPELAIALTPFETLCGFRPVSEIKCFIRELQELRDLIGDAFDKYESCDDDALFLKETFTAVLMSSKENIKASTDKLLQRTNETEKKKYCLDLFRKLVNDFPVDAGCFMVYFLNYLELKPREAIFLAANEPHAYISGDCIECMACSDNVVRAGLTPKFIDVATLCSMLTYKGEEPRAKIFKPVKKDDLTSTFKPPVRDFAVSEILVPVARSEYDLFSIPSASILIVISGCGKLGNVNLKPGIVVFIPANVVNQVIVTEDLTMYQAYANVSS